jgi:7-cyano-7-deazaguanine synthase
MAPAQTAVVLISGGLDSCVAAAVAATRNELAFLHASYGQRTSARELAAFERIADHYGVGQLMVADLGYLARIGGSSLVDETIPIPDHDEVDATLPSTYVPFRNANLLSAAVAWAEVIGAAQVYVGAHQVDSPYPDCDEAFFSAFNRVVEAGTGPDAHIAILTPLLNLDKSGIVRLGVELEAPLQLTWSCYRRQDEPCTRCHSCELRRLGFAGAGVDDPLL